MRKTLLILTAWLGVASLAPAAERPNVLWIVADDHAAYIAGSYGNTLVRTPNIDRLASTGVRFDRAYCNSPICTASRQSFLTGRYPRTLGVTLLNTPMPESEQTLADLLGASGYETAALGKMHFNSYLKHGFQHRLDGPDHARWLKERGPRPIPPGVETFPPWKPFKDPARIWLNGGVLPQPLTSDDMPSTFFAREAENFMGTKRDKPFFLMVSFTEPHSPFHFPVEYRGRIDPSRMPLERVGPEDDDQIPDIFRPLTDDEKRGITAAYYTSTEWLDHNVGRVLDALEKSGQSGNTIVVYCGDHGYSLGQHGRFEKHCSYEPAIRVPLIVRFPNRTTVSTTAALTELIDIVPTLLEWCGVATPENVQGKSLVPVLTGKSDRHRERVFVSYAHNDEAMVSDGRWKLVYFRGKRVRDEGYDPNRPLTGPLFKLFDVQGDPGEFTNLAAKPEHGPRVAGMAAELAEHLRKTSRRPELVPANDDPDVILEYCVQPDDVKP